MAVTLESLSLEVNASAKGASSTIDSLIGSLTALDGALTSPLNKLKELNTALKSIANTSMTKIATAVSGGSGGGKGSSGGRAKKPIDPTPSVLKEFEKTYKNGFASWTYGPNPLPTVSHYNGSSSMIPEEEMRKLHPEWYHDEAFYEEKHNEQVDRMARRLLASQPSTPASEVANAVSGVAPAAQEAQQAMQATAPAVKETKQALQETAPAATQAASAIKEVGKATSEAGNECKKVNPVVAGMNKAFKSVGKGIDRVGRMMSTMLIRTAMRSLIKHFGESWQAAYEFSKHMGGEFYQAVDKAKTLMMGASTSIVTAFAPAFQAMIPVINAVVSAIRYLCNAIQWLFSLLGMSSEFLGASTDAINKYSGAASGGGSATKDLLASFDELNVIQSQGGGGGGGGGGGSYLNGMFSDIVSDEMAKLQLIVGESLLAIGLILACTGHFGVGLGLMAIGAAAIVKTFTEDWGSLSREMQRELVWIAALVGASMLAIGAILAFSGANIPVGIGLMLAGLGNMYLAYRTDWDAVKTKLASVLGKLSVWLLSTITKIWNDINNAIAKIAMKIVLWAATTWEGIKTAWNSIPTWFETTIWQPIAKAAGVAWEAICQFWSGTIKPLLSGVWSTIYTWFMNTLWTPLTEGIQKAWAAVCQWWENKKSDISKAWGTVGKWFEDTVWTPIKTAITDAWEAVCKWWGNIKADISKVWSTIGKWFEDTVWNPIKTAATNAWNAVSNWWKDIKSDINGVWGTIGDWFKRTVWDPISEAVTSAWNAIQNFWKDNILSTLEEKWSGVVDFFTNLFAPIGTALGWLRDLFGYDGRTLSYTIEEKKSVTTTETVRKVSTSGAAGGKAVGSAVVGVMNMFNAGGAYGIPQGDVFVANEAGAEMIGTLNGRTTVANQEQIVEGIRRGLEGANEQQNRLLQQQNELLRQLLEKDSSVRIGASAALGRVVAQSQQMYARQAGG